MRINSIQPSLYSQHYYKKNANSGESTIEQPIAQTAFKGAKGLVGGFLFGVLGSAALAIATGGISIPATLAAYGAMGVGAGTAYVGDKLEDKLTGQDKK